MGEQRHDEMVKAQNGHQRKGSVRFGIGKARAIVRVGVVALIVVGFCGLGWGVSCAFGIDAVAFICPLGALESFLAAKTAAPRAVFALVCALAIIALFGRAFCAWLCPVPPIREFFRPSKSRKGLRKAANSQVPAAHETIGHKGKPGVSRTVETQGGVAEVSAAKCCEHLRAGVNSCACEKGCALAPVGGIRNGVHIDSRHAVLAGALASSALFGFPVFCLVCPVGLTFGTLFMLWNTFVNHEPSWALVIFPAILFLELVVFRKWCHKICPMGALMSLVGAKSPVGKPRVNFERCLRTQGIDCHVCVDSCPERLDPHEEGLSECTRCGLCKELCPAKAISLAGASFEKKKMEE